MAWVRSLVRCLPALFWLGSSEASDGSILVQTRARSNQIPKLRKWTGASKDNVYLSTRGVKIDPSSKRQVMNNFADLQYFANITVGGQEITGIVDTGSFELVVFENHCTGCGKAAHYDKTRSDKHSKGILTRGLFYGSGDIYAAESFDAVSIGPFEAVNQSYWEAYEAMMPVLDTARFQSIIGVGPPEMPSAEAWKQTVKSLDDVTNSLEHGSGVDPSHIRTVERDLKFSTEISRTPTMLNNLGVEHFSLCLLPKPGSNGYLVWNDTKPLEEPQKFRQVRIMGKHTWTVNMTTVRVLPRLSVHKDQQPTTIGCQEGCGAIIDSGTSLLMMPASVVDKLQETLSTWNLNCSHLDTLPDLVFTLDGHRFSLPPDAYLAEVTKAPTYLTAFSRFARLRRVTPVNADCQLSVMESYSSTNWGPLWILGMPFFRKYYTTFSIGLTHSDRCLLIASSGPDCEPGDEHANLMRETSAGVYRRRLDLSKMYISPLVKRAMKKGHMDL